MKSKQNFNPFLRSFAVFFGFVLMTAAAAIGLFYYMFSIPEPEGLSLASWPQRFTDSFSVWIDYKDGNAAIDQTGLARLDEYGLWLQVIDESGQEIFAYHKPEIYPKNYSASALAALGTSGYEHENTVFVGSMDNSSGICSYIVGFPYAIGKYMLYYDGEKIDRLLPAAKAVVFLASAVLAVLVFGYVFWLSRKLSSITDGIQKMTLRSFTPLKEKGMFSGIYAALNKMDMEIRQSDRIKEETERARREWIANITHDLKTPLSPIKGYAELLADNETAKAVQEYGEIILKNVSHVEKLLNDLKLTYQLDSGAAPYHPKEVLITRYLKELVIDIVNDPAFSNRSIAFESSGQELTAFLDPDLFRRAVQNIIINALVHNPPDTSVKISISENENAADDIFISIQDNGAGMNETELAGLFNRYYRGTNTKEKPEGTGLGLAIAKQIIVLHGGDVSVKSSLGAGTEFVITISAARYG